MVTQCIIHKHGVVSPLLKSTWVEDGDNALEDAAEDADLRDIVAKVVQLARDLPLANASDAVARATMLAEPLAYAVEDLVP